MEAKISSLTEINLKLKLKLKFKSLSSLGPAAKSRVGVFNRSLGPKPERLASDIFFMASPGCNETKCCFQRFDLWSKDELIPPYQVRIPF